MSIGARGRRRHAAGLLLPAAALGAGEAHRLPRTARGRSPTRYCRTSQAVVYFTGRGPTEDARLQAERGRGAERRRPHGGVRQGTARAAAARGEDRLRRCTGRALARAWSSASIRPTGALSAHDTVTLVVTKARYGLIPDLVGSSLADAQPQLEKLRARSSRSSTARAPAARSCGRASGRGVAAWPGLTLRLVVAR